MLLRNLTGDLREDLLARVNACLKGGNHHILDPSIDDGEWLKAKIFKDRKAESFETSNIYI